jgi:hypothetical protein
MSVQFLASHSRKEAAEPLSAGADVGQVLAIDVLKFDNIFSVAMKNAIH